MSEPDGKTVDAPAVAGAEGAGGAAGTATLLADDKTTTIGNEGAAAEGGEPATDKSAGAPDKYEFTLPEGVTQDEAMLGEFETVARELGLDNDRAQKLLELGLKAQQQGLDAGRSAWADTAKGWREATIADPEIGGKNLPASIAAAQKILRAYAPKEVRELLETTAWGEWTPMVKFLVTLGKRIGEDRIAGASGPGSPEPQSEEARYRLLYPSMFPKQ